MFLLPLPDGCLGEEAEVARGCGEVGVCGVEEGLELGDGCSPHAEGEVGGEVDASASWRSGACEERSEEDEGENENASQCDCPAHVYLLYRV